MEDLLRFFHGLLEEVVMMIVVGSLPCVSIHFFVVRDFACACFLS